MEMINLFINKAYLPKNYEKRNFLLQIVAIILLVLCVVPFIGIFVGIFVNNFTHPQSSPSESSLYWIVILAIAIILSVRFLSWESAYFARDCGNSGKFLKEDNPENQTKFFTGRPHRRGHKNPLW
jgi:hypothetical protein